MSFKSERAKKGMTLKQAAEAIGVSAQAISLWENHKTMPSASILPKIAEVYETTVDELLAKGKDE